MTTSSSTLRRHKQVLAALILLAGLYAISQTMWSARSFPVRITVELPGDFECALLHLGVEQGGELFRRLQLQIPAEAGSYFEQHLKLPQGSYTLLLRAEGSEEQRSARLKIDIPNEKKIRVDLSSSESGDLP